MCGEQGAAAAHQPVHQSAPDRVRADAVHPVQQQRVMGDDQVDPTGQGLLHGLLRDVHDQQDRLHDRGQVTAHQSHRVPALGQRPGIGDIEDPDDVGEASTDRHWSPARDRLPRPDRCARHEREANAW